MKNSTTHFALLVLVLALLIVASGGADAASKKDCSKQKAPAEEEAPAGAAVGYGGSKVQMMPFMAPYRAAGSVRYEPLTVRIKLDPGPNERSACFSVPYVHDRMLEYLFEANLTADDFVGERRDTLAKSLFDVAVEKVGKGYYTGVEIVGPDAEDLDCKSMTLSSQCK